jgi:hypothetical protein
MVVDGGAVNDRLSGAIERLYSYRDLQGAASASPATTLAAVIAQDSGVSRGLPERHQKPDRDCYRKGGHTCPATGEGTHPSSPIDSGGRAGHLDPQQRTGQSSIGSLLRRRGPQRWCGMQPSESFPACRKIIVSANPPFPGPHGCSSHRARRPTIVRVRISKIASARLFGGDTLSSDPLIAAGNDRWTTPWSAAAANSQRPSRLPSPGRSP